LVVGAAACRAHARAALSRAPFEYASADDPYAAAIELCRRPLAYRVVVLCLNSTYREELSLIAMIRKRLRHIDVYVAQTDGRQAALAEAMRLGATGLLADDGLHRVGTGEELPTAKPPLAASPMQPQQFADNDTPEPRRDFDDEDLLAGGEAVLTAEELRALLQEQPSLPPSGEG
jgi:hypothetical protein